MNKNKFHIALISIISMMLTCNSYGQNSSPKFNRNTVVVNSYSLTKKQFDDYERVLVSIDNRMIELKKQILPKQEKENKVQALSESFRKSTKNIFTIDQYNKWLSYHGGYIPTRFFIEDIGMTPTQFKQYREYSEKYRKTKEYLNSITLSATDRSVKRQEALDKYKAELTSLSNVQIATYLIKQNLLRNEASNLSQNFTIISEYKAEKYAQFSMSYNTARKALAKSDKTKEIKKKERKELQDDYENELKKLLTNQEYIACIGVRDNLAEKNFIKTYRLSNDQFKKYKDLQKKKAVAQLKVRQSKGNKEQKADQMKEIEISFKKSMQDILTPEKYRMWEKDNKKK